MDQTTINRYQAINPDTGTVGDIYAQLQSLYGNSGADQVASAALSGDETQVNAALTQVKFGAPLNTSTASILANQLETDPLGAPLQSLNGVISNTLSSFLKSPAVVLATVLVIFFALGGWSMLKGKVAKA